MTAWAFPRLTLVDPFRFTLGCELVFQDRLALVTLSGLQFPVEDFAESAALPAGPVGRIERKQPRIKFLKSASALRATHFGAQDREPLLRVEQMRRPSSDLESAFGEIARFQNPLRVNHTDHHVDGVLFESFQFLKLRDRN